MSLRVQIAILLATVGSLCFSQELQRDNREVAQFMHDVLSTYRSMSTYSDEGTARRGLSTDADFSMITEFSTGFRRPDKFRFYWTSDSGGAAGRFYSHDAIGSDGTKVWSAYSFDKNVPKVQASFDLAVAGATGISQGMAHNILALLSDEIGGVRFDQLNHLEIEKTGSVNGIDCVVVRGEYPTVPTVVELWIGKTDHIIYKGVQTNQGNSVLTFELRNVMVNPPLDDKQFSPPEQD